MSKVTGKVSQIVGPVIDVEFGSGADLPKIYDSLVKILYVPSLWTPQMD